jgi:hypothetical protein
VVSRRDTIAFALLLAGCIDTGTEPVSIPFSAAGTEAAGPIDARHGVTVDLERADLAFGPFTVCAGFQAGDNCDAALAEWTESAVVDALDPAPQRLGDLEGLSGSARSYMYDHGYVSLLTRTDPLELPAAAELGGASFVVEGTANVEGVTIPFRGAAVLAQPASVERGSPIVRSGTDEGFALELDPHTAPLTIRFDPRSWVEDIDFTFFLQDAVCSADREVVCAGQQELLCGPDGDVLGETDCSAAGQVCLRDVGCVDRVELAPGSQGLAAIRNAILAGAPPTFE